MCDFIHSHVGVVNVLLKGITTAHIGIIKRSVADAFRDHDNDDHTMKRQNAPARLLFWSLVHGNLIGALIIVTHTHMHICLSHTV